MPTSVQIAGKPGQSTQFLVLMLAAAAVLPDPKNPRTETESEGERIELQLLGEDMRRRGVLVPLLVRPNGDVYLIVDGHRRRKAALRVGIEKLPCIVLEEGMSDDAIREIQLVTALHRSDLSSFEIYRGLVEWRKSHPEANARQMSQAIGRSESFVSQVMSLEKCPPEILEQAAAGLLTAKQWYQVFCKGVKPKPEKTKKAKFNVAGAVVSVSVKGEATLDLIIKAANDLARQCRAAKEQGISLRTLESMTAEKAKKEVAHA
jgi:ParB/RepB/Spo0J family partition protein